MINSAKSLSLMVLGCLAMVSSARSETVLQAKTSRIVVFKDGYCMVTKEVTGRLGQDAKGFIEELPASMVLGSCWMMPNGSAPISVISRQQMIPRAGKTDTKKQIELTFDTESAGKDVKLTWSYFTPGIRWIPTYRIDIGQTDKANLMMQAEILDEIEDIEAIPIDLVVGVPNFRFKDVISPMSLQGQMTNVLQQVAPGLMSQTMSNAMVTQRAGETRGRRSPEEPIESTVPELPAELAGEQTQDLFVYTVPALTLRAGERAAVPIISTPVQFRHLYTWDVQLQRSGTETAGVAGPHASPARLSKNDIWHQIEITNTTGVPFTTGAAMIMNGALPVAQELMTYTSPGGTMQMPLTVAVDVRGTYAEEELARDPEGMRIDNTTYALIKKKGTLRITNHKKDAIDLLVACDFGGTCTEASDGSRIVLGDFSSADWKDSHVPAGLVGHSTIRWELKLKPGETKELTCQYQYYTH